MILFIAPNPFKVKEREGYLQRVAAIDELFPEHEKHYSADCKTDLELAELIVRADFIYTHSIYRAEEIIGCYPAFGYKIITDLHGVVPEEENITGEIRRSSELSKIESIVFANGAVFVAVTEAMTTHFNEKYKTKGRAFTWVVLPIFDDHIRRRIGKPENEVVYAGGAQKWQNADLIIAAINDATKVYRYNILTHSPEAFSGIKGSIMHNVQIKTVPSNKIYEYYKTAKLGFILRDNIAVNNVACPTKLIEYLSCGVVPIVKSPHIGDFEKHGYKYVRYSDFVANRINDESLKEYAELNYKVIDELKKQTEDGKGRLVQVSKGLESKGLALDAALITIVASACRGSIAFRDLNAANYQINEQVRIIQEYADSARYYKREVENLQHQLPFRTLKKLKSLVRRGK